MTDRELKIWENLYQTAKRVAALKPWELFYDSELLCVESDEFLHPIYFSILGKSGVQKGIAVYMNPAGAYGLNKILSGYPVPEAQLVRYHDCLSMLVRGNDDLTKRDISRLNRLKLSNDKDTLYFRRYEYGYCPDLPNADECESLTKMLAMLETLLNTYIDDAIDIDFNTQMLKLSSQNNVTKIEAAELKIIAKDAYDLHVTNDSLMKRLKSRPRSMTQLELDIAFLKPAIRDDKFRKPFPARVLLLTDAGKGTIIINEPVSPVDDEFGTLVTALVKYVDRVGRPKSVIIRDDYIERALADTCRRLGIELKISPELHYIDRIVSEMNQHLTKH